jgi:hypothetical protein
LFGQFSLFFVVSEELFVVVVVPEPVDVDLVLDGDLLEPISKGGTIPGVATG